MPKLRRSERFSKFISQNPICVVQKVLLQVHEKRFVRSLVYSHSPQKTVGGVLRKEQELLKWEVVVFA